MKAALMEKIQPIIEEFVEDTLTQFKDLDKIRKSLRQQELEMQLLLDEQKDKTEVIRVRSIKQKEEHDIKISEIDDERADLTAKTREYMQLSDDLRKTREETQSLNQKARIELAVQKDNTEDTKQQKDKSRINEERYKKLLLVLEKDQEMLKEEKATLAGDRKKIDQRETDCENKFTENISEAERLNMMELELKAREKEIARLVKRHKLEQQIGVTNG